MFDLVLIRKHALSTPHIRTLDVMFRFFQRKGSSLCFCSKYPSNGSVPCFGRRIEDERALSDSCRGAAPTPGASASPLPGHGTRGARGAGHGVPPGQGARAALPGRLWAPGAAQGEARRHATGAASRGAALSKPMTAARCWKPSGHSIPGASAQRDVSKEL